MQILLNESARFVSLRSCECFVGANLLYNSIRMPHYGIAMLLIETLNHSRLHVLYAHLPVVMVMAKAFFFLSSSFMRMAVPVHVNDSGSVCVPLCHYFSLFCQSIECKSIRGMYFWCVVERFARP